MSRSYKRTPAGGITKAESEKLDKRIWHKRMRAKTRDKISYAEDAEFPIELEVSNKYSMAKDGRQYFDKYDNPNNLSKAKKSLMTKEDLKNAYQWYSK